MERIRILNDKKERLCGRCKQWKEENSENYSYKNKKYPDQGFISICRECGRKSIYDWTKNNPEEKSRRDKECYLKHKEKRLEQIRKYLHDNPDIRLENQRRFQNNNPEKLKEYGNNRKNKTHTITNNEWNKCKEYFNNSCAYCGLNIEDHYIEIKGIPRKRDFCKDHAFNNGANDITNCIPACKSCNSRKYKSDFTDWYNNKIDSYEEERYNNIVKWLSEGHKIAHS